MRSTRFSASGAVVQPPEFVVDELAAELQHGGPRRYRWQRRLVRPYEVAEAPDRVRSGPEHRMGSTSAPPSNRSRGAADWHLQISVTRGPAAGSTEGARRVNGTHSRSRYHTRGRRGERTGQRGGARHSEHKMAATRKQRG